MKTKLGLSALCFLLVAASASFAADPVKRFDDKKADDGPPRGIESAPPDSPFGRSGAVKRALLKTGGGTEESEAAVKRGLDFLVRLQNRDGSWRLDDPRFGFGLDKGGANDIAGTAFGLLPLLAAGHTPKDDSPEGKAVRNGLTFLLRRRDNRTGAFDGSMYAHAIATITVCEAQALKPSPELKAAARRGIDFLIFAQHDEGGWRYGPKQAGDTSVTGWVAQALAAGRAAGLDVPMATLKKTSRFLDHMTSDDEGYGYTGPGTTVRLTAIGLLCRELLEGWGERNARMQKALGILATKTPDKKDLYYAYYGTQVLRHLGGKRWNEWNDELREQLIKAQDESKTEMRGSWAKEGEAFVSGRLMQTSLALLILEAPYRYVPLFDSSWKK